MKKLLLCLTLFISALPLSATAEDFIVVGHEGKVYDTPNSKAYATTNRDGEDINLSTGMVFKRNETRQGWNLIEYSPGLNGFILQSLVESPTSLETPESGVYPVNNIPGTNVKISIENGTWTATLGTSKYAGQLHDGALIFFSAEGDIILSVVKKRGKVLVYSYSNDITKFF
ncbi:MAG: hypothetical protein HDS82_04370 [Bacteroidales bacterium]|nr:hypothetical protein [Bacteroidales bacterium]